MISALDRQIAVELINEARASGARLTLACNVLNISDRTYQRWTEEGDVTTDQRPLATCPTPKNKITQEERQAILKIATSSEYADLVPSQIVPKLADEGKYIVSESTFYRILKVIVIIPINTLQIVDALSIILKNCRIRDIYSG